MSGILDNLPGETRPKRQASCSALHVAGKRYANSAAKFWPTLVDDALQRAPDCSAIELAASCSGALAAGCLHPERELQETIEDLLEADLEQVIRNTITELEVCGPPGPVEMRILAAQGAVTELCLPLDVVDAELMPYLLSWLMNWAAIPDRAWNDEIVTGSFTADDVRRKLRYEFSFHLINRHLSEGLYRRVLRLQPKVHRHAG